MVEWVADDETDRVVKEKFWSYGDSFKAEKEIVLRKNKETDKEMYILLQKECSIIKSTLREDTYCAMLWKEHTEEEALNC